MRVGVVGAGSIGRRHIENLIGLGCTVAVCDVSAEARARVAGAYALASVGDALPFSGLDALVIATPYDQHLSWVEEAVRRRLPFFVEKPIGTAAQLPRWRELARMELPVHQVGYMLRFHRAVALLKQQVPNPVAGRVALWWDGSKYADPWLESSHEIDLAWYLCGTAPVQFDIRTDSPEYRRHWVLDDAWGQRYAAGFSSPEELGMAMYEAEMAHFLACVQGQRETRCTLQDGLRALESCVVAV